MDRVPNRWYAALTGDEVPTGRPVGFERLGEPLVFWRDQSGAVCCAVDRCPHRGAALSGGRLTGGALACPYHGFEFDPGGACTAIPAHPDARIPGRMRLDVRPTQEAHGFVWIWSGPGPAPAGPPPFFDFSGYSFAGSAFQERWDTHYARVVENELDFAHLPFVHHNTIGRGFAKAVEIEVSVEGDHLQVWQPHAPGVRLEVIGPNLWRMPLGPKLFNFIAFAPVSDAAVVLYLRTYQRIATWAPAAHAIGLVNRLTNPVVLAQDARTVPHQRPRVPSLTSGEVYVPSDRGIVAFHRWRQQVKRTADEA